VILADVNVLIYAFRADFAQHVVCRTWLERVITGDAQFGISPRVLGAVARITTNRRSFRHPSAIDEVFAYCDTILNQPHCEIVRPGERHWMIFRRLCIETGTRGARITDAWLAALAIEHGCTWITYDRDYARFADLDWQEPRI
jgi:toxin-antitoxin system PIN domain toxin